MKIDLYITYYELSHLQSFIPINSKIFWVFDEILSMIEEEIDKEVMKMVTDFKLKRIKCPICEKELSVLNNDETYFEFWCDDCNIDIYIQQEDSPQ